MTSNASNSYQCDIVPVWYGNITWLVLLPPLWQPGPTTILLLIFIMNVCRLSPLAMITQPQNTHHQWKNTFLLNTVSHGKWFNRSVWRHLGSGHSCQKKANHSNYGNSPSQWIWQFTILFLGGLVDSKSNNTHLPQFDMHDFRLFPSRRKALVMETTLDV